MQAPVALTSLKAYQVLEYSLSVLRNIASKRMVADNQWLTLVGSTPNTLFPDSYSVIASFCYPKDNTTEQQALSISCEDAILKWKTSKTFYK